MDNTSTLRVVRICKGLMWWIIYKDYCNWQLFSIYNSLISAIGMSNSVLWDNSLDIFKDNYELYKISVCKIVWKFEQLPNRTISKFNPLKIGYILRIQRIKIIDEWVPLRINPTIFHSFYNKVLYYFKEKCVIPTRFIKALEFAFSYFHSSVKFQILCKKKLDFNHQFYQSKIFLPL